MRRLLPVKTDQGQDLSILMYESLAARIRTLAATDNSRRKGDQFIIYHEIIGRKSFSSHDIRPAPAHGTVKQFEWLERSDQSFAFAITCSQSASPGLSARERTLAIGLGAIHAAPLAVFLSTSVLSGFASAEKAA